MDLVEISKSYQQVIDKALLPSYALHEVKGGYQMSRTPGAIGRRRGQQVFRGRTFAAPPGGLKGYQADQELRALKEARHAARKQRQTPLTPGQHRYEQPSSVPDWLR